MERHPNLLSRENSLLLVVDLQDAFAKSVPAWEALAKNAGLLVSAARTLDVPVIASTQNEAKLGEIAPQVAELLGSARVFDKMTFSCWADAALQEAIRATRRRQIVLCGVETHICVAQTALDMHAAGLQAHIAADAVGSRTPERHALGLERMNKGGAFLASAEAVVYEWMGAAGTSEFRALLPFIR